MAPAHDAASGGPHRVPPCPAGLCACGTGAGGRPAGGVRRRGAAQQLLGGIARRAAYRRIVALVSAAARDVA
ncbi:hypothetical protein ACFRNT_46515 [Streptomyces sp. NPDC056697]|uniref:hypothetical protein n=1 Tax=Streptomyces sp. NPDC056697 TaxID=3345915 RepID=UPI003692EEB5